MQVYQGIGTFDACCTLCHATSGCVAFTADADRSTCSLKKDTLSHQESSSSAQKSGVTPAAHWQTHYGMPHFPTQGNGRPTCNRTDEIFPWSIPTGVGAMCAPACTVAPDCDSKCRMYTNEYEIARCKQSCTPYCPTDVPAGVTATPRCVLKEPVSGNIGVRPTPAPGPVPGRVWGPTADGSR